MLIVEEPHQLRALGDALRAKIVLLLNERAASTTELAQALGVPKGTAGHHVKVLETAGLVRVVRTRKVRALTEKFYGRVARLFVLKSDESLPGELRGAALAALMLRQAADEAITSTAVQETSLVHARLQPKDVRRFQRRLYRLIADIERSEDPRAERHALALALFEAPEALPPRDGDG